MKQSVVDMEARGKRNEEHVGYGVKFPFFVICFVKLKTKNWLLNNVFM